MDEGEERMGEKNYRTGYGFLWSNTKLGDGGGGDGDDPPYSVGNIAP
jgi:hypothetical protein